MIGSKEKQRTYDKKSHVKINEDNKEKGITTPNEEEMEKTLQKKRYDKIRNETSEIKEEKCIHRNLKGSK